MRTSTRIGAGALSASVASVALLGAGVGSAFAQTPAPCDPTKYPPVQCQVVGGNQAGNPPLVADKTIGRPGSAVAVRASGGCNPGSVVTLALLRVATDSEPRNIGSVRADDKGGYSIASAIPADTPPGVYILYTFCPLTVDFRDADGKPQQKTVTAVTTTSFVVSSPSLVAQTLGSSTSQGASTATSSATTDAAAAEAAVRALAVPEEWTAPASWHATADVRSAVTRAVNLRLAALRTSLPATPAQAEAPAPRASGSPVDTTLLYAGSAAVAFLLLGAAGWRRHVAATATNDEVAQ